MVFDANSGLVELQNEIYDRSTPLSVYNKIEAVVEDFGWMVAMDLMSRNAESIAMYISSIVSAVRSSSSSINTVRYAGRGEILCAQRDVEFSFGRGMYR